MASKLDELEHVEVESRQAWRAWLMAHHTQPESVWLVTWKKHCGERHLPYEDKIEEALCFGWVDSHVRRVDEDRMKLLFSPRKPKSAWSKPNKERVERLIAAGLMQPAGLAAIERAKDNGYWSILDDVEALIEPPDLAGALDAAPEARRHWDGFGDSVKKGILWWIKSAKRAPTRDKRVAKTVAMAAEGKRANYDD